MGADFQTCHDSELARESQTGSLPAFEELVYRYEGRVYRFVVNCCGNSVDAREVTQDTFVRAFQAMARFDCRRPFAPWLFAIARRKCIDHQRAMPPVADAPMPDLPDEGDPAELLARQEERRELWGLARRWLPEVQFQALWLRYAEELNVADIAQVLGKTQTHIKVLLFRARVALRDQLEAAEKARRAGKGSASSPAAERSARLSASDTRENSTGSASVAELAGVMVKAKAQGARKGPV